ncbi:hypothetical protein COL39_20530 [Bacillus cereus]|uniref:phytanoyl-CoA dioxygenase family protein n=1 Tax=Bacillus cereus TaxID=1396 RepID=UPI000BF9A7CF|nr:phytanoyl-CoA dioxygenase family protein [Bacillus cereus]PFX72038.1 hypothetical protein COL39_20530 [Bacillus cereus]
MNQYVKSFIDNGFVVIPSVIPEKEIKSYFTAVDNVMLKVNNAPEAYQTRYTFKEKDRVDTWGVNHIFDTNLYEESFGEIFYNKTIMNFIQAVLGDELRLWGAHALWSPQKINYELNWHRDYGDYGMYNSTGASTHVQFNVALTNDSCFIAIPGSHKRPLSRKEEEQLFSKGTASLPGETVVYCKPGDVLFMNAHTFHRGACSTQNIRRALHISLQAKDEPTGGHGSWTYMRKEGLLERMNPVVQSLMKNAIEWDDKNPLSLQETVRLKRIGKENKSHQANNL